MLQRFFVLDNIPELRSDPVDPEKNLPEIEVVIPVEVYWEVEDIIQKLKYARYAGMSTAPYWKRIARLLGPYIVFEKDRLWFKKNIG